MSKMKRAIKFRAWQQVTKVMFHRIEKGIGAPDGNPPFADYLENEQMIVMQFTGLSDRSGKEIYEGDIVRGELRGAYVLFPGHPTIEVHVVEYDEGMVLLPFHIIVGYEDELWMEALKDGFEIIGNIYEHPGLLSET